MGAPVTTARGSARSIVDSIDDLLFADLAELAALVARAPWAGVFLLDSAGGRRGIEHGGRFPEGLPPFEGTPCELVLGAGASVLLADARLDDRYAALAAHVGLCGYVGVPMFDGEELIGTVCAAYREPLSGFDDGQVVAALARVAQQAPRQLESQRRLLALQESSAREAETFAALERNEAGMRTIVASLPDGLLLQDEEGRTLVTNPAFSRILELPDPDLLAGTTRGELRALLAASPAGQGDILLTSMAAVQEGHAVLGRRLELPTGRTIEWDYLPVGFAGGHRRLWHLRDITARLVAEQRLAASERRFEALTSSGSPTTGVFQLAADGSAVFFDELCCEIFGVAEEAVATLDWTQAVHPDDREHVTAAWIDATSRQGHYSVSYRVRAQNGAERRLDVEAAPMHDGDGAFCGFIGTMTDVTAQVDAARARERSELLARNEHQRLSDLVAGSPEPILSIGSDGQIVGMNPAALTTFAMTRQEALGRPLTELVSGADRAYLRDGMEDALSGSGRPPTLEVLACGARPRMFLAELVLIPMRRLVDDPDGVVLTAIFRDISDHHRAQLEHIKRLETERAARQEAEAAQAELEARLQELHAVTRAKDTFVSMISHELRTPLTSIRTFSELLLEDGDGGDEAPAGVIARNVERLERIVGDLLEVKAGVDPAVLHLEQVDLRRLVRHECASLRPAAAAVGVELVAVDGPPVEVCADPGRLGQVIGNLVDNALKFTPAGERVVVDAQRREGGVVLEVRDNGVGIAAEELPRVFERFYQGSAGRALARGSGLGLSIAALVADAHGGQMDVSSRPGQGTTFTMTLPPAFEGEG